ncbi:MAG: AsnC family transcriptional regulator [Sphingobacteriales bacterium SCN 48-20]|jgi:Lrp/AsnC family leucine-responsive transcriptional regulator|uniref:Lrp/AsnC family transcriptional regulator n=1 Tax=Terrimonas ferruginea TaxID=249 RepID=UPI0003FA9288|nr:Lrp/AsnC family transcriptional regulator [Terrimonas ferruginea]MBN8784823.1 Lrp/AsnC family transcriptional regulator [Terrimonas ferruginea]ODT94963.1 MAG: AsnC family transcriptional regulator [Sphingobacteriales bacterium SCN 48-20]OJW45343.1 MAG: AsnC family transcriptional regulator [Sphingobacteriales bacterium 48-107]
MPKPPQKAERPAAAGELDEKDRAILRLLQQNARMTVKEIAEAVHLSPTPVHERIRRLESSGIIRQYAALLDPAQLGKRLMVICYVSLKQHNKNAGSRFIKAINELDEVIECYNISGQFDFMLKVMAADMDDYYHFHVDKLSQVENMGQVQSVFVMGVIKQTHQLL